MGRQPDKNSGFTIIEVVLVLAIAGLIFLAVFIALPALQQSQRDNHRKNDVLLTTAGVKNYMIDHLNQPPPDSGQTGTGEAFDMNGDGVIDEDEQNMNWQDGDSSADLAPYVKEVLSSGVTTQVSVFDASGASTLYVMVGNTDKAGLITVFLGAGCPTEYPRPNVMTMALTGDRKDVAVFRYLEAGSIFCEDF